ncbi:MAG TPA: DUF5666 domain-containing protein [Vicinamibacterales bacterium]|nr:DUF5666 domain-containing protein [Vicinamibacterales bacterium]
MQTAFLAASFAALSIILSPAPYALAQDDAQVVRGVVTTIKGNSLTVQVRGHEMIFAIDTKTSVETPGGGTKQRAASAAGRSGPNLPDLVKAGQSVAVTYYDANGALRASKIRTIRSGAGESAAESTAARQQKSSGVVQAVGDRSITISGSAGGGATFTQTFTIDEHTRVTKKGAGTASRANGGHVPFTALIGSGDHVVVSYEEVGDVLRASDVFVRAGQERGGDE